MDEYIDEAELIEENDVEEDVRIRPAKTREDYYRQAKHQRKPRQLTMQEVTLGISADLWTAYKENLGRSPYALC